MPNIIHLIFSGILGFFIGLIVEWLNKRLPEHKNIFAKEFFTQYLNNTKCVKKYIIAIINAIIYIGLLYKCGVSLDFIKFAFLSPCILSALMIDYKLQIIPNRLNLTVFEVGIVFLLIYGILDINIAIDMFLGMLLGGGIFLIITLIGGLIAGKEAMGLGDVKLMGVLGLFFGMYNIIVIAVISFFIGAIISIFLLVTKKKTTKDYIPFGPFIVIGSYIMMFLPLSLVLDLMYKLYT